MPVGITTNNNITVLNSNGYRLVHDTAVYDTEFLPTSEYHNEAIKNCDTRNAHCGHFQKVANITENAKIGKRCEILESLSDMLSVYRTYVQ